MKTTFQILGGLFLIGLIMLPFSLQLEARREAVEDKGALQHNLFSFCYEIGMKNIRGFSAWDYKPERRSKYDGRASILLRHKEYANRFLKCLYADNTVQWNTYTRSGYYKVNDKFSKQKGSYQLN